MSPPQTLEPLEVQQLLDELLVKGATSSQWRKAMRNYMMALTMLETGVRVGELVKLERSDLYWQDRPVISIIIRAEIAKKARERRIPVSTRLSKALNEYHRYCSMLEFEDGHCYAFKSGNHGRPLTTRQVERIIRGAAIKSIGYPIHPHVLRHTFASRLMRKAPMRIVQELLGHQHLSSTQIYTHPNGDDLRRAIEMPDNQPPSLTERRDAST